MSVKASDTRANILKRAVEAQAVRAKIEREAKDGTGNTLIDFTFGNNGLSV